MRFFGVGTCLIALGACAPAPSGNQATTVAPSLEETLGPLVSAKFIGVDATESSVGATIRQKYDLASIDFQLSANPDVSEDLLHHKAQLLCHDQTEFLADAIGRRKFAEVSNLRVAFVWPITKTLEAYRVSFLTLDDCELFEVN